jgi:AcrR family transcriptional regulator
MIADEVGVTKAAVYHHFHTREELLNAIVDPLVDELRAVIEPPSRCVAVTLARTACSRVSST